MAIRIDHLLLVWVIVSIGWLTIWVLTVLLLTIRVRIIVNEQLLHRLERVHEIFALNFSQKVHMVLTICLIVICQINYFEVGLILTTEAFPFLFNQLTTFFLSSFFNYTKLSLCLHFSLWCANQPPKSHHRLRALVRWYTQREANLWLLLLIGCGWDGQALVEGSDQHFILSDEFLAFDSASLFELQLHFLNIVSLIGQSFDSQ